MWQACLRTMMQDKEDEVDFNLRRRAHERAIASEVVSEIYALLSPALDRGADVENLMEEKRPQIAHLFGSACRRHGLKTEEEARRVWSYVLPAATSLRRRFGHLQRRVERGMEKAGI